MEFLVPYATEVPDLVIGHLETPSPLNPLGVKGAGEAGTIPVGAVIASAIEEALGVRGREMPLSPLRLFELRREAGAGGGGGGAGRGREGAAPPPRPGPAGGPPAAAAAPAAPVDSAQAVTLEALGLPAQQLFGPSTAVAVSPPPPAAPLAPAGSLLRLFFSHSPLLDPTASSARVRVNGEELAALALDPSSADGAVAEVRVPTAALRDRKSTRLNSSHSQISYAV